MNASDYTWIYLNMSEYAGIRVNMPKSVWMAFALHFSIVIPCLLERLITYFNIYTKLEAIVWRNMGLFSWKDLKAKFHICCYLWGSRGRGPWILVYLRLRVEQLQNIEIKKQRPIHEACHINHPNEITLENIMNRLKKFIEKFTATQCSSDAI